MSLHSRAYCAETDFFRVRDFLSQTYRLTGQPLNWTLERFEYARYFVTLFHGPGPQAWEADIRLWETERDRIVGVVLHEALRGDVFLQIHPAYRHIEGEMLAWAEAHLTREGDDGRPYLNIWVNDCDALRQTLLQARGYQRTERISHKYQRSLDGALPPVDLPQGYQVRALCEADIHQRCAAMGLAFGSEPVHDDVYRSLRAAPDYRPDLDLVITAPEGSLAAFALLWHDTLNRIGIFEPVGTHPAHQRRGLGKALMAEGFRRLKALDATTAYVGTGIRVPANRLYQATGFTVFDIERAWHKRL